MDLPEGNYRKTVVGVTYQDSEFALIQKHHWHWWDFPQGGLEPYETLEQAVLREVIEEFSTTQLGEPIDTGIRLKVPLTPEALARYPDRGNVGKELFYLTVPYLGDKEELYHSFDVGEEEFVGFKWCGNLELMTSVHYSLQSPIVQVITFMARQGLIV
ncbi:MAG: NUDIX hydrolase [Nanoarchaeota archaeon]|nr:NUDIX hydrolase [Nanoarchaeota archaeon]